MRERAIFTANRSKATGSFSFPPLTPSRSCSQPLEAEKKECGFFSDDCFRHPENGVMRITKERWQRASWGEQVRGREE